jgi:hypothetical protein
VKPRSSRIQVMYRSSWPQSKKRDGGFPPPTKKPQPRSPDIDDPPRSSCRPAKVLPFQRNRHQLRHADAAVGVWAETSRYPSEFVALDL